MKKNENIIYLVNGNTINKKIIATNVTNEKLTFSYFAESWLRQNKMITLKPASYDRLETTYRTHLKSELGDESIVDITNDMIQSRIISNMFESGSSYSTIKKCYDFLNECLDFAKKKRIILDNPMELVVMPRKDLFNTKEIKILSEEEINSFKKVCNLKYSNGKPVFRYGYPFLIMLYTGVRVGEMCAIRWSDIDFEKKFFYVKGNVITVKDRTSNQWKTIVQSSPKTKSGNRVVPLSNYTIRLLKEYKEITLTYYNQNPNYIIETKDHHICPTPNLSKSFGKMLDKAGLSPFGIHSLRHTYASMLFDKGVDVGVVSKILGHSSVRITYDTYIHILNKQKLEAVDIVADLFD